MLKMKPACERCQTPLAADTEAAICSFECTFCPACAQALSQVCPNCGGELVRRPRRVRSPGAVLLTEAVSRVLRRFRGG